MGSGIVDVATGMRVLGLSAWLGAAAAGQVTGMGSTHPQQFGGFGTFCAVIPDLSGDGKQDIIVGAPGETVQGQFGAGRAYIFNGSTGALIKVLISPHFEVSGSFGNCVAGIPDVNGDGKGDIAVGAHNEGNTGLFHFDGFGRVYLFNGATGTYLRTINSPNPEVAGQFGFALAGLADLNGDGKGELAIGAWYEDPGAAPQDSGKVYIFNGASGALIRNLSSPAPESGGGFGVELAAAPDLTGDGKPDLIVGAGGETAGGVGMAGRTHIFNGATGAFVRTLVSTNKRFGGNFGRGVAGVPDATGDGRGDVLVGAPGESPGNSPPNCGRAYLFNGATGALIKVFAPGQPEENGAFGFAVAGVPDLSGDARGDLAIAGNRMDPPGLPYGGRVFIYSGASGAFIKTLASPKQGEANGFGTSVAALADVNGNGKGDLVIGSPSENAPNGASTVGRAYLFRN